MSSFSTRSCSWSAARRISGTRGSTLYRIAFAATRRRSRARGRAAGDRAAARGGGCVELRVAAVAQALLDQLEVDRAAAHFARVVGEGLRVDGLDEVYGARLLAQPRDRRAAVLRAPLVERRSPRCGRVCVVRRALDAARAAAAAAADRAAARGGRADAERDLRRRRRRRRGRRGRNRALELRRPLLLEALLERDGVLVHVRVPLLAVALRVVEHAPHVAQEARRARARALVGVNAARVGEALADRLQVDRRCDDRR